MEDLYLGAREILTVFGWKIVTALVIVIVGRWVARWLSNMLKKVMSKRGVDATLVAFGGNLIYFMLLTFVFLAALAQIGVETTSFIAVIGAAGLAIGLALQGSLANFAAGFLLMMFRPIKVGQFVTVAGESGTVEEVQIFTTKLKSPDNKEIIIPNGKIMGDTITNFSAKDTRRVDFVFGIGYGDDIPKAKKVMADILEKDERILKDPAPTIGLVELGDNSVNFAVRPWVNSGDYWPVYFDTMEKVKQAFDAEGISIPFPQRDVHLFEQKN